MALPARSVKQKSPPSSPAGSVHQRCRQRLALHRRRGRLGGLPPLRGGGALQRHHRLRAGIAQLEAPDSCRHEGHRRTHRRRGDQRRHRAARRRRWPRQGRQATARHRLVDAAAQVSYRRRRLRSTGPGPGVRCRPARRASPQQHQQHRAARCQRRHEPPHRLAHCRRSPRCHPATNGPPRLSPSSGMAIGPPQRRSASSPEANTGKGGRTWPRPRPSA
jgi:hypothetical protein